MQDLILDDYETKLVLGHRAKKAAAENQARMVAAYLKTTSDYYNWMQREGLGNTYSTFCNNYEYTPSKNEDRSRTWRAVSAIIKLANEESK